VHFTCLDANITSLVEPMIRALSEDFFRDVLIADASGRVLFEQSPAPLRAISVKSWLDEPSQEKSPEKRPPEGAAKAAGQEVAQLASLDASALRTIQAGEAKYRMYVQPVAVALADGQLLAVAGLREVDTIQAQALRVRYGLVVWIGLWLA